MKTSWLLVLTAIVLGSLGCPKPKPGDDHEKDEGKATDPAHAENDEHAQLPKHVKLTPQVIADAKIKTAPVGKEALVATLALPGDVVSDPDRTARISSPVAGRVESVSFKEGSVVKKGDVLAVIRVPELGKVRGALVATLAKAKAARANATRTKTLWEQHLATEQAYLDADSEAQALEAEASSLGTQLAAMGATAGSSFLLSLRAPISGAVVVRDAVVGQTLAVDQTLGTVADLSEVWFLGRVFEKDLGRLHAGAKAEVQLNAYADERFDGSIEYLGQQVDPVARTVTARIRLTNRGELLRIGLFGTARVSTGETLKTAPHLVVPRSAITEIAGKSVVFVRQADGDFAVHEIVLGDAAIGKVEILSGLREGEEIVVEGVFTLKSIVLKSTIAGDD